MTAEGGQNKEMLISRRLEGLRSSRLDHSMQNFMAVLFRRVPRPDSPDLAGKIKKNWGRDRRRREKPPKAGKTAEGGKNRRRRKKSPKAGNCQEWVPKSSDFVPGGIFSWRIRI